MADEVTNKPIEYTVKQGDTANAIARRYGYQNYKDAGITGFSSGNPDLIRPGEVLTIGGGTTGETSTPAPTSTPDVGGSDVATRIINEGQQDDMSAFNQQDSPKTRESFSLLNSLSDLSDTEAPEAPSFTDRYFELREDQGLNDLEQRLSSLDNEEKTLQAQKRKSIGAETGKPVALNVIQGRVTEQERNFNERLDTIQREKDYLANQIQTRNSLIETVMDLEDTDYQNAKSTYETKFNQALDIIKTTNTVNNAVQDNARANASVIVDLMSERGLVYSQLTPKTQTQLTKLSLEAGFGSGLFAEVLNRSQAVKHISITKSKDGSQASVIYQNPDGTYGSYTLPTGLKNTVTPGNKGFSDDFIKASQFIQQNPTASSSELRTTILAQTDLSVSEANALIESGGELLDFAPEDDGLATFDTNTLIETFTDEQLATFAKKLNVVNNINLRSEEYKKDAFITYFIDEKLPQLQEEGYNNTEILDYLLTL